MNYIKDWLIPDLRTLEARRSSLSHMKEEIETLRLEADAIKATNYDRVTVSGGGGNAQEDKLIANIAKRQELEANLRVVERQVMELDDLLAELNSEDRLIIEKLYIKRERNAAAIIADTLGYDVSRVYQKKNEALLQIARRRFGLVLS